MPCFVDFKPYKNKILNRVYKILLHYSSSDKNVGYIEDNTLNASDWVRTYTCIMGIAFESLDLQGYLSR
jgi:hypothetical protein